ncbi:hypothetical protein [Bradyrhizobium sp. McL0615]|uniref:hypothetical protein n=1 Tax=Bradyrhizobium sp. McL0615 TaxID=3415673 RepID=UPI003CF44995
MAFSKTPPLEERVKAMRAEINAFIDKRVQDIKRGDGNNPPCEGVPETVLRNILMSRSDGCLCRAYLNIAEQPTN